MLQRKLLKTRLGLFNTAEEVAVQFGTLFLHGALVYKMKTNTRAIKQSVLEDR